MIPVLSAILPLVGEVIDRVVPDKAGNEKAKREIEKTLATAAMKGQLGQLEINKVEAAHKSLFVAGWRPAIGWVCMLGLLYNTIIANVLSIWIEVPEVDTTLLVPVMMGMLGLGAMRSDEKVNHVSREK